MVKNVRCGVLDSYMNEAYLNLYLDNVSFYLPVIVVLMVGIKRGKEGERD